MSSFNTHLIGGVGVGSAISLAAMADGYINPMQAGAVFVAGTLGGLLPDLDSDTGKPLFFLFQMISVMIPSLLFFKAVEFGGRSTEFIVFYFTVFYFLIHYGLFAVVKALTVHRGSLHSIPFAAICGGLAYLLFRPSGWRVAAPAGVAVVCGALVHLLLDEIGSIGWRYGFAPYLKSSFGTALKLRGTSPVDTVLLYLILLPIALVIVSDQMGRSPFFGLQ